LRVIQAIHTHQAIYGSGWPRSVNIRFWAFSKLWITPRNEVLNTIKPTFKVRWGFHVDENVQFQGIWNVARPPASFWRKRYSEFISWSWSSWRCANNFRWSVRSITTCDYQPHIQHPIGKRVYDITAIDLQNWKRTTWHIRRW
jgi:hypothetical protein